MDFPDLPATKSPNLTAEQRKLVATKKYPMDVNVYEAAILRAIRKTPNGSVTVHMLEFIPVRYTIGASVMVDPTQEIDSLVNGEGVSNG